MTFEIKYLRGVASAGSHLDRNEVEFPPHPVRLFCALVAAAHSGDKAREKSLEALRWLENPPADPVLHVPEHFHRDCVEYMVAANYANSRHGEDDYKNLDPRYRPKKSRRFPVVTVSSKVSISYPSAPQDVRDELARLAEGVAYLGRADSQVHIDVVDSPPRGANWTPDATGHEVLRLPYHGYLDLLTRAYAEGRRPPSAKEARYRAGGRAGPLPSGPFGRMVLLGIDRRLPSAWTLELTEAFRAAAISMADREGLMTDLLHGHSHKPHCAYLALPDVGHAHADGHIVGLGVVFSREADPTETANALRAIQLIKQLRFRSQNLRLSPKRALALSPQSWSRPARRWSSVTPILLDRFPKRETEEEILASTIERAGLSRPLSIETSQFSRLAGVPRVRDFQLHRSGKRRRPAHHVVLEFEQPIAGPVMLGAGRYFGLGLMRPWYENRAGSTTGGGFS